MKRDIRFIIYFCLFVVSCGTTVDPSSERFNDAQILAASPDAVSGATANWVRAVDGTSVDEDQWVEEPPSTCEGPNQSVLGVYEDSREGRIPFKHCEHQLAGVRCETCHHDENEKGACGSGADCHQRKTVSAPSRQTALHKACRSCHVKQGLKPECSFCHRSGTRG